MWPFRNREAAVAVSDRACSADRSNRREWLGSVGTLPVLGIVSAASSGAESDEKVDAVTQPTFVTRSDKDEYARLRNLDLRDPKAVARQQQMPVGKIGGLTLGRLISGSNLISMNMHARDLDYVGALAAHYNTEERIFMTMKKCEELGADSIVLKNHNFKRFRLSKYWDEWGGRMKWIADVITTDIEKYERVLVEHLELGASAVYLWGGASDTWYYQNKQAHIVRALEIMRKYDVPAGIGAHRLEPIAFCEREGLVPDFYIKTLHHDRYWSAHPPENRRFMEMFEQDSPDHAQYHDNMFCHKPEETVAFMQDVKVPWIAFKVLAAGAIPPEDGLRYAFDSGADFVCLGMFDFQVAEDAELVKKTVAAAKGRKRPWV
ncbi:MAG TPA: hypothetical protein VMY42_17470 [Thermoguttaceae bacterium]|nr:hypothetical protein [Thermoguttaceae bacterium]